jgi:hypothetical protein
MRRQDRPPVASLQSAKASAGPFSGFTARMHREIENLNHSPDATYWLMSQLGYFIHGYFMLRLGGISIILSAVDDFKFGARPINFP